MPLRSSFALALSGLLFACGGSVAAVDGACADGPASSSAVPDGTPAPTCTPAGPTPVRIADLGAKTARELVPNGDALWFGAYDPAAPMVGDVFRVGTAGGVTLTATLPGRRSDRFAFLGREIAFVRLTPAGDAGSAETLSSLVLRDLDTGAERMVVAPSPARIVDVRTSAAGLLWSSYPYSGGGGGIARLDGSNATTVATVRFPGNVVAAGDEVFFVRGDGVRELEAVRIRDGARRTLATYPADIRTGYRVFGVDATDVYVARTVPIGHGTFDTGDVRAVRKDGSGERVVVTIPGFGGDALLDPHYVTWIEATGGDTIVRFPFATGIVERIVATGSIGELAVDACNLYWSVYQPSAIFARSRRL